MDVLPDIELKFQCNNVLPDMGADRQLVHPEDGKRLFAVMHMYDWSGNVEIGVVVEAGIVSS
jgi:hypothetical protein